ncbi:hypothetical protein WJX72_004806 [[Myrmecia] bisecta]|uniref:Peptidase S54 rhomboid domain-containing protein n=1 Tax=[Myrmecia] bisecta TaxID=41462 RepID=A0AAW1PXF8_9CHLO
MLALRVVTGLAKQICKPSVAETLRNYRPAPPYRPGPTQLSFPAYQPPKHSFWKPVVFCFSASAAAFTGAAVLDEWERQKLRQQKGRWGVNLLAPLGTPPQHYSSWEVTLLKRLPEGVRIRAARLLAHWHSLSTSERVVYGIIAVNSAVFLAWQIPNPRWQAFMYRYFLQHLPPLGNNPITLLTTTFSHQSLVHFAVNMMVLRSFVALDVVGALRGWRFLDHYGHLGGAMFGLLYAKYGEQYIWGNRHKLLHLLGLK